MKSWVDECWWLAGLVATALILGLVLGQGTLLLVVALLVYAAWMIYRLTQLDQWLKKGAKTRATPDTVGILDSVVQLVHREQRRSKRQKENLRKTIARFSLLASELPDATVVLDDKWQIQWCNANAETLLGISSQRDTGYRLDNLMRAPEFIAFLHDTRKHQNELEIQSPIAADRTLLVTCVPAGRNQQILSARDITQRIEVHEMRKAFVADVSHELRTPLTVIQGHLELLRDSPALSIDDDTALERIHEQSGRMVQLVEDLLKLSKLESRMLSESEGRWIALDDVISKVASGLSAGGLAKDHEIDLQLDAALNVFGMETELLSCCQNLLQNALAYTPAGTQIQIEWRLANASEPESSWIAANGFNAPLADGTALLLVRDQGPGIEPEHLPRLSQRFYRADRDRSRSTGGTGLGLAIVKHIAQRHGGQLYVASEIGKGSLFGVSIPPFRVARSNDPNSVAPDTRTSESPLTAYRA